MDRKSTVNPNFISLISQSVLNKNQTSLAWHQTTPAVCSLPFRSLIELPRSLRNALEEAGTHEAYEQLRMEEAALKYLRRLEVISALSRRRQLPSGFELCMCDAVQELLSQPKLFHLYLKHLRTLQEVDVSITRDIAQSYTSVLEMLVTEGTSSLRHEIVGIGFRFVDFLVAVEMWSQAEEIIDSIINFLRATPAIENWVRGVYK